MIKDVGLNKGLMRLEDTLDLPGTGFDEDDGGNGKAEFIILKQILTSHS